MDPIRTFGYLRSAEGYALEEVAHRVIGTRAVINHRRSGSYMTLERLPARRVAVRLHFLGEK